MIHKAVDPGYYDTSRGKLQLKRGDILVLEVDKTTSFRALDKVNNSGEIINLPISGKRIVEAEPMEPRNDAWPTVRPGFLDDMGNNGKFAVLHLEVSTLFGNSRLIEIIRGEPIQTADYLAIKNLFEDEEDNG